MSVELSSAVLDKMLLVCLLETKSTSIRSLILTETTPDDYGTPLGREVRQRIETLRARGKSPAKALDFSQDAALSSGAQDFIRGTPRDRQAAADFPMERVKNLLDQFKLLRNRRLFSQAVVDIKNLSSGPVDEDRIEQMSDVLEKTLIQVRQSFSLQPIVHQGMRETDEGAARQLREVMTYSPWTFVSTGLEQLDLLMSGFERGNLVTLSATRGGCKSMTAMVMGVNQYYKANHSVVFVSMEMTRKEVLRRLYSNISGIQHDQIRRVKSISGNPELKARLAKAVSAFHRHGRENKCTFSIWDISDPFFTPMKMDATLAPMKYDVIIVDYLTLFNPGRMDKWEMVLEYSRYLKSMAKRLNCVIIVLTQLNDEEKVKYGRGIEENTDYWIYWRWREDEERETGLVELQMEKARHTKTQKIQAIYRPDIMQIRTLGDAEASAKAGASNDLAVTPESDFWGGIEGRERF
jgi:replicative DNA helicase